VKGRIRDAEQQLAMIRSAPTKDEIIREQLPKIRYVLDAYPMTDDIQQKNELLRSVISKVVYQKTKKCTRADNPAEYMVLDVMPAYPE
jgi:hypothetical protein